MLPPSLAELPHFYGFWYSFLLWTYYDIETELKYVPKKFHKKYLYHINQLEFIPLLFYTSLHSFFHSKKYIGITGFHRSFQKSHYYLMLFFIKI